MQALINEAYSVTFDLMVEGEYASFDVGETTYSIYDNSGALMTGYIDLEVTTADGQNRITIEVPAIVNTVGGSKVFEKRTVVLKTKSDDKSYALRESYYVTDYLNYTVTPKEVISLMGIRDGEVLEPEVDLVAAYLRIATAITQTVLATALASGTISQLRANDAIRAQAALDLSRTIELRALKKLGSDSLNYTRFDGINFDKIRMNISALLQTAISDTQGIDFSASTVFLLTTPTDAVTGV